MALLSEYRVVCRSIVLVMVPYAIAGSVGAAEWSIEPSVAARTEYDDNIRFTAAPHSTVWGVRLSPVVNFNFETETSKVTGGLAVNFNRYFGESDLDTTDHYLTLRSSYRLERDLFTFDVDSIRDSTLVSELLETGVIESRRQRHRLTANPSWNRALTESVKLTASYLYSSIDYIDTSGTSLIDYTEQTGSVGMSWQLAERDVASAIAYYDRFETSPAQITADTYGMQIGYDRDFAETLHASFSVGVRKTKNTLSSNALVCEGAILFGFCLGDVVVIPTQHSEDFTGYTLLARVDKRWPTDRLVGSVSRQLNPTGVGALVQTDRIGVTWTRQWSPTVTSTLEASAYRSRYPSELVNASDSRFYRIQPSVSWRLTDELTLTGGYSYSHVTYDVTSLKASANVAYVVLAYSWPKIAASR